MANKELKSLESKAATAQAAFDAARARVDDGEASGKSLKADYRDALANGASFDRLLELQAKRGAIHTVMADLNDALGTADAERDSADEALRHERKLQQGLEELSPRAQALIQAYKAGTLPATVRLTSGQWELYSLVGSTWTGCAGATSWR